MLPTPENYLRLAEAVEANLQEHVLSRWFPAALDRQNGGFLQNSNEDWSHGNEYEKSIVYQARLTWVASQVAQRYPNQRAEYLGYARHGLEFLSKKLWDKEKGGPFWALDNKGQFLNGGAKHSYGIAFSIYALAAGYHATKDPAVLQQAQRTFQWLDTQAHDSAKGGYFEALTRDGKPILPGTLSGNDVIGTTYGHKSMNTHIHLLEALTALFEVWPDSTVRGRLQEVFHIVRDKIVAEDGNLFLFFTPDWHPTSHEDSYGHDLETAYLLREAANVLGQENDPRTNMVIGKIVEHGVKYGLDTSHGGFYDSGPINAPAEVTVKIWWTQAEALNTLLQMHHLHGQNTLQYWEGFLLQWKFITEHQIDRKYKGWYGTVNRDGSAILGRPKSDSWTDPYHQGRALMNVADTLRLLAGGKPVNTHP